MDSLKIQFLNFLVSNCVRYNFKPEPCCLYFLSLCLCLFFSGGCAFKFINRTKGIEFFKADESVGVVAQRLNVFAPSRSGEKKDVLIFIHGGNWNSGNRTLYSFFGSRMARKGIVTVVIDYPLSPAATYKEMALVAASAVKWVKENISSYGGNPDKIFVSGHSAGGHLAALIALDSSYFDGLRVANPVKGIILIDAAGLDMFTYLKQQNFSKDHTYLKTFTANPAEWKKASPVFYLHPGMAPFLVFEGGKTYPSIKMTHKIFMGKLLPMAPLTKYEVIKGKHHIPMITQFLNPWNPRYDAIIEFMNSNFN